MAHRGLKLGISAILALQLCVAVLAQDQVNSQTSQTGQTGTVLSSAGMTAAKPGQADGVGNLQLGGIRHPLYRLNCSDVVAITFTLSPEYDQTLRVQPDGYVSLKDAGQVFARGLTLDEFKAAVEKAYTGYLHDPQVAVSLQDFEHPYFVAGGEIGHPGKYELRSETSIIEAVQIAGGFTHEAKHSQVILFHHVNDGLIEAHVFNLKAMLREKSLAEVPNLRPGDMVFVPQNYISKMDRFLTKPALSMYVSSTQF